jgi:aminopeptidase-like protein
VAALVDTPVGAGDELFELVRRLYPICRSITGDGVRETLRILGDHLPVDVREVPSGTKILDWVVPPEWNVSDAHISTSDGDRVVDFRSSNLHVVSYSVPVARRMTLDELRPHLHTLPDQPTLIPYRTSYYEESWGFCLSHDQLAALTDDEYEVVIDSTLAPGSLTYGEVVVPGETDREILISTHVCHPALADDNLSGIAVSAHLARSLRERTRPRHTFRFVYAPGTIGAITWLAEHDDVVARIDHGLTLTCLGDDHRFTYKRTVGGDAEIDRVARHVLGATGVDHQLIDFFPYGYDERQYNSPGYRLAVGSLMRGQHGAFSEYHTSADNLDFVSGARLAESFSVLSALLGVVDANRTLVNLHPFGEPQLGSRGLYGALGGTTIPDAQLAMLWVLNLSDGSRTLLDIAERAAIEFDSVAATAAVLEAHGLLAEAGGTG